VLIRRREKERNVKEREKDRKKNVNKRIYIG
jgi:hypothetical protein